jgi:hypothetical protein
MSNFIDIHRIDEFSEVQAVTTSAISEDIILNIRELDEDKEAEYFIRQILCDLDKTPHCATEEVDILTDVHVEGDKRLAAFIVKGKGTPKVTAKLVTHQLARLFHIPSLGLAIFGAVGHIHDSAKTDFIEIVSKIGCDYIIINARDFARLFIAYGKVCPRDGTPYNKSGVCRKGHKRKEDISVTVKAKIRYDILDQRDLSNAGAKRYSATIFLGQVYDKKTIKNIIQDATDKLKVSNYYRNEMVRKFWQDKPAHVVWLYIATDLKDINEANWICRSCWVDSSLPHQFKPSALVGNDRIEGIDIKWNDRYEATRDFFDKHYATKEQILALNRSLVNSMVKLSEKAIEYFKVYKNGDMSEDDFLSKMREMEPEADDLYDKAGNINFAPPDCTDYDDACQAIYATVNDMFMCCSEKYEGSWPKDKRDYVMRLAKERFYENLETMKFEEKKLI